MFKMKGSLEVAIVTNTKKLKLTESNKDDKYAGSGSDTDVDTDTNIAQWANDLLTRPFPQISNNFGDTSSLEKSSFLTYSGFDVDSAVGKFTWHTVGRHSKVVPCLFRKGLKYCCVRMVDATVTNDLQRVLPQDIFDSAQIKCRPVTTAEAKLLSFINAWHCDGLYGKEPFTEADLLVATSELEELYSYLLFVYNLATNGGQNKWNDFSRCGFVRINNDFAVPYTVLQHENGRGDKAVPQFYFEGQIKILAEHTLDLTGWDLSYLKVCCRLAGVKKELITSDSLKLVKLSHLKSQFPQTTVVTEQCWLRPHEIKDFLGKNYTSHVSQK